MTTRSTMPAGRLARLLFPGRNPLARGVDRLEARILLLAMAVAVLLVPVALTFGSLSHASLTEQSAQQAAARYESVAVLTEDAPATSVGAHDGPVVGSSEVSAKWRLPDGTLRTGQVKADDGLKAGARVPVWLDRTGQPVDAPLSPSKAAAESILVAVFGWFAATGLLALGCYGFHTALQRYRYRAWDVEWARLSSGRHDQSR